MDLLEKLEKEIDFVNTNPYFIWMQKKSEHLQEEKRLFGDTQAGFAYAVEVLLFLRYLHNGVSDRIRFKNLPLQVLMNFWVNTF